MTTTKRTVMIVVLSVVALVLGMYALRYAMFHSRYGTDRTIRYLRGEALATQTVNDAAEWLASTSSGRELEAIADALVRELGPRASELPKSWTKHPLVPLDRMPDKFRKLGGVTFAGPPDVVLRQDDRSRVTAVELEWRHGRYRVVVFVDPPAKEPRGFHVRKVSDRVYVVAIEL